MLDILCLSCHVIALPSHSLSQTPQIVEAEETESVHCQDRTKRMSICSSEVCALSEKKSAAKGAMVSLMEDPSRASPIPFTRGGVVNGTMRTRDLEIARKSEGMQTLDEGNVQITRKTKVEESFTRSQKMYSAEIRSDTLPSSVEQAKSSSPELEQIMEKKHVYHPDQDTYRLTPVINKPPQSDRCLTPEIENIMGKPHGTWSPMPAACFVRPLTPSQIVSFPPEIPQMSVPEPHPRIATPEQFQEARETVEKFVDHSKHVNTGKVAERTIQSSQQLSRQQVSAFVGRGKSSYSSFDMSDYQNKNNVSSCKSQLDNGYSKLRNQENDNYGNGYRIHENGNLSDDMTKGEGDANPTVTKPDDFEEKRGKKSSRKTSSISEEETSRRVFSDFGGPQVSSAVNVESVTEGGVQRTSVTKSQKMEYASCEFESSRKSSVLEDSENKAINKSSEGRSSEKKTLSSDEPKAFSQPKYSGSDQSKEEEMVTKSQVEEIIKQELNKVFQMAQTMEKTDFGEMYEQKDHQSSSEQYPKQSVDAKVVSQSSKNSFEQKSSICNKIEITGDAITSTGKLTSGLTIAPERSFTPQPLESNYPLPYQNIPSNFPLPRSHPEPPTLKPGYIPVSGDRESPLLQALTIAPDRPYSPLPTATIPENTSFITTPKPQNSSMLEALTTAPSTSVHLRGASPDISKNKSDIFQTMTETKHEYSTKNALKSTQRSDFKPIPVPVEIKPLTAYIGEHKNSETHSCSSFPPVTDELKSAFKGISKSKYSTCSESESQVQSQHTEMSKQTVSSSSQQKQLTFSSSTRSITPSGLHPPNLLPYYQQNIGEIPLAHRSNSPVPHQIKAPSAIPPRPPSVTCQDQRRDSVKAMSKAYTQQLAGLNNQQSQQVKLGQTSSSVSYVSSGVYSSGAVTKAYSYEQEHKPIDTMGFHASPLAGKVPLAGENTLPKCGSPVLGKLDHTKQVFKPGTQGAFKSPFAEQANLRQAPPYFLQEKDKSQASWNVVKEIDDEQFVNKSSFNLTQYNLSSQPTFPSVNKVPAYPEPSKPCVIPDAGPGGAPKSGTTAGTSAPRRGRGILNSAVGAGVRVPLCASCNSQIR